MHTPFYLMKTVFTPERREKFNNAKNAKKPNKASLTKGREGNEGGREHSGKTARHCASAAGKLTH
jgi:hypothetical protein